MLRSGILLLLFLMAIGDMHAQQQRMTMGEMKKGLETSTNPPLYAKTVLKKRIVIDTILIQSFSQFQGMVDSLAYHGKVGKVYGPYAGGKVLVQILAKAPALFNHVGQIFIDTSVFTRRIADSLATDILIKVRSGEKSFEDMAVTYSMGGESRVKGDLGWVAAGSLQPQVEAALAKIRKGDMIKIWSRNGVHIVRKLDNARKDTGYVLVLKVLL